MDEIEYKFKSENSVLISHAISKLIEIIQIKLETEKDISKISEYKFLTLQCIKSNVPNVSASACQGLVMLVETGLCDIKSALTSLVLLCSSTNYEAITLAVSQLCIFHLNNLHSKTCNELIEYNLDVVNQHPFISILKQYNGSSSSVVNQMKQIMHYEHERFLDRSVELLRPAFLYILCNPSTELNDKSKWEAWQLITKSVHAWELEIEILLWLRTNGEDTCVDASYKLFELAEMFSKKNPVVCTALAPLIASVTIQLLEYGHNPMQCLSVIFDLIQYIAAAYSEAFGYMGNIMIALMTEVLFICPRPYLRKSLEICTEIVDKMPCNAIMLSSLAASLLPWLAYPVSCSAVAEKLFLKLKQKIALQERVDIPDATSDNEMLLMFSHSNKHIQFYLELIRNLHSLGDDTVSWLEKLSLAPIDLKYMCKLTLCGMLLHSNEPTVVRKACDILVCVTKEVGSFELYMVCLVQHKLTQSRDSSTSHHLLRTLPEFTRSITIVSNTLKALRNGGRPLSDAVSPLYIRMVENEPRFYGVAFDVLIPLVKELDHILNDWRSAVVCAQAVKRMCEVQPERSEELVPILSRILNQRDDLNGGAACALALDSILALCRAAVIGIYSTWQELAPKMRAEKRTVVLESLCRLFADVPTFRFRASDDHDKFIADIATQLWRYAACDDTRVAKAAFKALTSYHLVHVPLSALPADFRSDLAIEKAANKGDKPEDALQYIPGACWIQMLQRVNKSVLPAAGDLLISYIEDELTSFRSQIYNWPQGEPQNFKYLPDRSVIRAVGEFLRRNDNSDPNNHRVMMECLRVFAHKYKKPLPNVKWDFLEEIMQISQEPKKYSLSIASRHCKTSQSAKLLMEGLLSLYTSAPTAGQLLLDEQHMMLYSHLDELCQAFQPKGLKSFLETTIDYIIDKIVHDDEKSVDLFNCVMSSYVVALKGNINIGNRALLSTMLERIFGMIELSPGRGLPILEKYFAAMTELTLKDAEKITSPSTWWEETPTKLRNAIALRAKLAFSKFADTPSLTWLNESIDAAAPYPDLQKHMLESMQRVQTELRLDKSCDLGSQKDWILDFMSRIALRVSQGEDIAFYCDILFVSVISFSGMDCLLPRKELLITSQDVRLRLFPLAISMLVDRQIWKSVSRQIMKWLNHTRSTSISDVYVLAFQSALMLLRYEEDYNAHWMEYLSFKTLLAYKKNK